MTNQSAPQTPTRRLPNPWVAVPVLIATAAGWFVGSRVASISCGAGGCLGQEILWGVLGALVGFVGTLVVAVLAVRSLAEWASLSEGERQQQSTRDEPPTC